MNTAQNKAQPTTRREERLLAMQRRRFLVQQALFRIPSDLDGDDFDRACDAAIAKATGVQQ